MLHKWTNRFTDDDLLDAMQWADDGVSREHIAEMLSERKGVRITRNQVCGRLHRIKTELHASNKPFGTKPGTCYKKTGHEGASNTDAALTETSHRRATL